MKACMPESDRGSPDNPGVYEIPEDKITTFSKGSGQGMQTLERMLCKTPEWCIELCWRQQ